MICAGILLYLLFQMCLSVCQQVLAKEEFVCEQALLLIQYVTVNLSELLEREDRWKLLIDKIGITSLGFIPEVI